VRISNIFVGVVILTAAGGSSAFSLGKARGAVVLGQPLALSFEVRMDADEDLNSACVDLEVSQGDSRIDASKISWSQAGAGAEALLNLRSSVVVDEPAVTVILRAGCNQKATRKYVLLTDLPSDVKAVPASVPAPVVVRAPTQSPRPPAQSPTSTAVTPAMVSSSEASSAAVSSPPTQTAPVQSPDPVPPGSTAARKKVIAKVQPVRSAPVQKARLKLDSLADSGVEVQALLRMSSALGVVPQDGASPQREQAAATWAALTSTSEQIAAQTRHQAALEAENKSLLSAVKQAQSGQIQAQQQVADLEDERYSNPLVYGLASAIVVLLAGLGYLLKRRAAPAAEKKLPLSKSSANPWWQTKLRAESSELPAGAVSESPVAALAEVSATHEAEQSADPSILNPSMSGLLVDLDLSDSAFRKLEEIGRPGAAAVAPVAAQSIASRAPRVPSPVQTDRPGDLFDVQQHAEFFVSLGQYDEAIEVLAHHVDKYPEEAPLAYLDLLKIHHMLSHTMDFARLRERFNRVFSGDIPPFSAFSRSGKGLEGYPRTLSYIEKVWGTPRALTVIEDSLFRPYAESIGESFDLDAFKDLLVLQSVAHQLAQDLAGVNVGSRVQAGDLSLAFQAARDGHSFNSGDELPPELMPFGPISGFGPSTQSPQSESRLDLDLSEPAPTPEPASSSYEPTIEFKLPTQSTDFNTTTVLPGTPIGDLKLPGFDVPANSPLDTSVQSSPNVDAKGNDDPHLIDFDLFEAEIKRASNKASS
jgi:hypothetical protein